MVNAVIFDMDGVISDTQSLHAKAESEILKRYGVNLSPEEITKRYAGVKTSEFTKKLLDEVNQHPDIDALMKEKWDAMHELAKKEVIPINGSQQLIKELHNNNFKLAVASASSKEYVNLVLTQLGVISYFGAVVSADDVKHGKPSPEIFLLAATKIGAQPKDCLVIEDGISGMIGAKSAGMKCVGLVPNKNSKDYPADILVTNLKEIILDNLNQL